MTEAVINAFSYPFVVYAFIVGVLISLCSSLFGVTLVLKRFSFIGDGLSHVAFGALSVATVLNLTNNMLLVLPITVVSAVLLLRRSQNAKLKGDAAIALISVGALAVGYFITNVFGADSNIAGDACTTLFGSMSILTLDKSDVLICGILSVLVIAAFVVFYNKFFAVTFDEEFAGATGVKVGMYNIIIAVIVAVIIVLAMNLVGSLLISALVIFPAISAMRVFKSFLSVTVCSAAFSVIATALGITVSVMLGTPVGSTVVIVDIVGFMLFFIVGALLNKIKR